LTGLIIMTASAWIAAQCPAHPAAQVSRCKSKPKLQAAASESILPDFSQLSLTFASDLCGGHSEVTVWSGACRSHHALCHTYRVTRCTCLDRHGAATVLCCDVAVAVAVFPAGAEFIHTGPLTPNSSPLCDPPASPMTRSKSEAFGLSALHKRLGGLGGWVGSSSNLSNLSSSSPTTTASTVSPTMGQAAPRSESPFGQSLPAKFAVEGSLDSVTACTRAHPVHSPAGLQGCRVQGLAELHEVGSRGGLMLRKPLKAIFVPPREVSSLDTYHQPGAQLQCSSVHVKLSGTPHNVPWPCKGRPVR
jgi:hypothetical protein